MARSTIVDRQTVIFLLILAIYIVFQFSCTVNVLAYLPDGFATENFYHPLARNLISHGVYATGEAPTLELTNLRPPFYAFALSIAYRLFGAHEVVGVILNNTLLTAVMVLVYLIGRRICPSVGLLAVVLLMADTIFLAEANSNQSDLMFTFLLTSTVWCFLNGFTSQRQTAWLLAGCFTLALAVFTRAVGMYLWLPVALSFIIAFWQRVPARRIAMYIAAVVIIQAAFMVPWMLRNQATMGNSDYAGMRNSHVISFWAPLLVSKRLGISHEAAKDKIWDELRSDPKAPKEDAMGGAYENYLNARAKQLILDNAAYIPPVMLDNIPRMFISYASEPLVAFLSPQKFAAWQSIDQYSFGTGAWNIERRIAVLRTFYEKGLIWIMAYGFVVKIVNLTVFIMSFVGIFLLTRSGNRQWRDMAWLIFLVYGCITLISLLVTQGRFRVPVMPAFALMASFALHYMWQKFAEKFARTRR